MSAAFFLGLLMRIIRYIPSNTARQYLTIWLRRLDEWLLYDSEPIVRQCQKTITYWWRQWFGIFYWTPEEWLIENYHRSREYEAWPAVYWTPEFPRIDPPPGHIRVQYFRNIGEWKVISRFGKYTGEQPQMRVDLPLEPNGDLNIGKVRRMWGMDKLRLIDWTPRRHYKLFAPADPEMLSAIALHHLVVPPPACRHPTLLVTEVASPESLEIRRRREEMLGKWYAAPLHWADHARICCIWTYYVLRPFAMLQKPGPAGESLDGRTLTAGIALIFWGMFGTLAIWYLFNEERVWGVVDPFLDEYICYISPLVQCAVHLWELAREGLRHLSSYCGECGTWWRK